MRGFIILVSEPKTILGKNLLKIFSTIEMILATLLVSLFVYMILKGGNNIQFSTLGNILYWSISLAIGIIIGIIFVWIKKIYPITF